jgi:acyl carrier protein
MRVKKICAEVFNVSIDRLNDEQVLNELENWDSLAHMILITKIEDEFQVQFTGDQIADMRTVGDIRSALIVAGASL